MVFGSEKDTDVLPLSLGNLILDGICIKRAYYTKFLGVTLDENLTWTKHISEVTTKVSKNIGVISKARKYLDSDALRSLYFAFIYPYISYGNIAWGSTYKSRLTKIHRLQKRIVRIMSHAERTSNSRPLMVHHGVLNVYEINVLQTMVFLYKHQHHLLPEVFTPYFQRVQHRYNSRLMKYGYREKLFFGKRKHSIVCRGPYIWNRLNCAIAKVSPTLINFKHEMIKFLRHLPPSEFVW